MLQLQSTPLSTKQILPGGLDYLTCQAFFAEGEPVSVQPRLRVTLPVDWLSLVGVVLAKWVAEMPPRGEPFLGDYARHASNRNCSGAEIEFTVLKSTDTTADIEYRVWAYRPWPGECDERA